MSEQTLSRSILLHTLQDRYGNPVTIRLNEESARLLIDACAESFGWEVQIKSRPINEPAMTVDINLEAFAKSVLDAAKLAPSGGRFGPERVFINHVWRVWQNTGGELDLNLFKHNLLACHQQSLLQIGSAVLMHTLNAVDLAQSETIDADEIAYHFVVLPKE
ncbi:MAG: hypothetical protein AAF512_13440 [Pseudomonadota bacterium]